MLNARFHKILILLLLLAFTSQTMATAAMNCEQQLVAVEMPMDSMMDMDMSAMDHSDPAMAHIRHMSEANTSQNPHQQIDCCKTMGHCIFGGCTLAALDNGIIFLINKIDSTVEDFYLGVTPSPLVSSLYRPPIFC